MKVGEIAQRLVELCRQGKFEQATDELYSKEIVSVEAFDAPDMPGVPKMPRIQKGIEAIKKKGEWWVSSHDVHGVKVDGPWVSMEKFAVVFDLDVTFRMAGKRFHMVEAGVYTVKDGKIVHEEFLYAPQMGMG